MSSSPLPLALKYIVVDDQAKQAGWNDSIILRDLNSPFYPLESSWWCQTRAKTNLLNRRHWYRVNSSSPTSITLTRRAISLFYLNVGRSPWLKSFHEGFVITKKFVRFKVPVKNEIKPFKLIGRRRKAFTNQVKYLYMRVHMCGEHTETALPTPCRNIDWLAECV